MQLVLGGTALWVAASLAVTGCATKPTGAHTVHRSETGRAHAVESGEVIYVRPVTIQGEVGGLGAVAGGAMGLALGNLVGGGRGQTVARTGGAIAGAAVGSAVEQNVTTVDGVEVTVLLQSGEVIVVIQSADEVFRKGDYVRVLRRSDGGVRVMQ